MPGRVASQPQKRVLMDTTNIPNLKSPPSAKKRKLNGVLPNGSFRSSQNGPNGVKSKLGSSQPKSQFETEVLEKMTQDISDLRHKNAEKDQQWDRPPLGDFSEKTDTLRFQQIEIEEGTLHGGKVTLKMFGVSEVSFPSRLLVDQDTDPSRVGILSCSMSPTSCITFTSQHQSIFNGKMSKATKHISKPSLLSTSQQSSLFKWCFGRTCLDFKETRRVRT